MCHPMHPTDDKCSRHLPRGMAAEGAKLTRNLQQMSVDSRHLLVFGQRLLLGNCNQAPREPGPVPSHQRHCR